MEAIESIVSRRLACGDDSLELIEGPASAVRYVLQHRQVPREVLAADSACALMLVREMEAEAGRLKYDVITLARAVGVTWRGIAALLGMRSAQGAEVLYFRLRSQRAGGPRDARAGREDRRAELRRRQTEGQREGWALSHARQIADAASEVLASPLPDDAAELAEEVEVALGGHPPSPQEVWEALRMLLPGLPASALSPVAAGLVEDLTADWTAKFGDGQA